MWVTEYCVGHNILLDEPVTWTKKNVASNLTKNVNVFDVIKTLQRLSQVFLTQLKYTATTTKVFRNFFVEASANLSTVKLEQASSQTKPVVILAERKN